MEVVRSFETLVHTYQPTRRHTPEYGKFQLVLLLLLFRKKGWVSLFTL
jgi:hypothetical protein